MDSDVHFAYFCSLDPVGEVISLMMETTNISKRETYVSFQDSNNVPRRTAMSLTRVVATPALVPKYTTAATTCETRIFATLMAWLAVVAEAMLLPPRL